MNFWLFSNKIILRFLRAVFLVVFYKIILHFLSEKIIYNKVRLSQKVLTLEFTVEAIIIFVKHIKKASGGIFTLLVSQLHELRKIYPFCK